MNCKTENQCNEQDIFILVRLISNYSSPPVQGDFASLQRGLNSLYSTEYKSALATAKTFLIQTTIRFVKATLSYKETKQCVWMFSTKLYHNCDVYTNEA